MGTVASVDNAMSRRWRVFQWRKTLDEGVRATIEEPATRERVNSGYMRRALRLTLLAREVRLDRQQLGKHA